MSHSQINSDEIDPSVFKRVFKGYNKIDDKVFKEVLKLNSESRLEPTNTAENNSDDDEDLFNVKNPSNTKENDKKASKNSNQNIEDPDDTDDEDPFDTNYNNKNFDQINTNVFKAIFKLGAQQLDCTEAEYTRILDCVDKWDSTRQSDEFFEPSQKIENNVEEGQSSKDAKGTEVETSVQNSDGRYNNNIDDQSLDGYESRADGVEENKSCESTMTKNLQVLEAQGQEDRKSNGFFQAMLNVFGDDTNQTDTKNASKKSNITLDISSEIKEKGADFEGQEESIAKELSPASEVITTETEANKIEIAQNFAASNLMNKPKKGFVPPMRKQQVKETPKKVENTPKKVKDIPKKVENTPKKVENTPKRIENTTDIENQDTNDLNATQQFFQNLLDFGKRSLQKSTTEYEISKLIRAIQEPVQLSTQEKAKINDISTIQKDTTVTSKSTLMGFGDSQVSEHNSIVLANETTFLDYGENFRNVGINIKRSGQVQQSQVSKNTLISQSSMDNLANETHLGEVETMIDQNGNSQGQTKSQNQNEKKAINDTPIKEKSFNAKANDDKSLDLDFSIDLALNPSEVESTLKGVDATKIIDDIVNDVTMIPGDKGDDQIVDSSNKENIQPKTNKKGNVKKQNPRKKDKENAKPKGTTKPKEATKPKGTTKPRKKKENTKEKVLKKSTLNQDLEAPKNATFKSPLNENLENSNESKSKGTTKPKEIKEKAKEDHVDESSQEQDFQLESERLTTLINPINEISDSVNDLKTDTNKNLEVIDENNVKDSTAKKNPNKGKRKQADSFAKPKNPVSKKRKVKDDTVPEIKAKNLLQALENHSLSDAKCKSQESSQMEDDENIPLSCLCSQGGKNLGRKRKQPRTDQEKFVNINVSSHYAQV